MDGQQSKLLLVFNTRKVKLVVPSNTSLDQLREKVAEKLEISGKPFTLEYYDDKDFEEWIEVDADYELPEKGKLKIIQKVLSSDVTDGATGNATGTACSTVDDTTKQSETSPPGGATEQPQTSPPADDKEKTSNDDDNPEQQELVFPICSNAPSDESPTTNGEQNPTGASGAAVAGEKIWKGRDRLYVYFMDSVDSDVKGGKVKPEYMCIEDWKCRRHPMSITTVMAWARIWNFAGFPEIPYFEVTERLAKADIRVRFTDTGGNWSMVGIEAKQVTDTEKPTMMLNLGGHSAELMESLVVHEFGHALGLEHEHQRSDFWDVMEKYLDVKKMQSDPFVNPTSAEGGGAAFGRDWFKKVSQSVKQAGAVVATQSTDGATQSTDGATQPTDSGTQPTAPTGQQKAEGTQKKEKRDDPPYDPTSIMHYWFDIKWIERKTLQVYANIDKEVKVEPDRTYLQGLHKRFKHSGKGGLAKKPSMNDYRSLVAAYGGKFVSSTELDVTLKAETPLAIIQGPSDGVLHVNKHLRAIRNEIWDCRSNWRRLGVELELTSGTLDAIDVDKHNSGDKLGAVLEKWMHTGRATIDHMVEALEAPVISRMDLAAQIKGLKGDKRAKVGLPPE